MQLPMLLLLPVACCLLYNSVACVCVRCAWYVLCIILWYACKSRLRLMKSDHFPIPLWQHWAEPNHLLPVTVASVRLSAYLSLSLYLSISLSVCLSVHPRSRPRFGFFWCIDWIERITLWFLLGQGPDMSQSGKSVSDYVTSIVSNNCLHSLPKEMKEEAKFLHFERLEAKAEQTRLF